MWGFALRMIIRHDIDPSLYLAESSAFEISALSAVFAVDSFYEKVQIAYDKIDELLKPSLFASVQLEPELYACCNGMGVLISPHWVLSAAHVAIALSTAKEIEIADSPHKIENVVLHPNFRGDFIGDLSADDRLKTAMMAEDDIALIRLEQAVTSISPLPLYRQKDEIGKVIYLVDKGDYGNGLIGPDKVDGRMRIATNRVETTDDQWLMLKFDAPPVCTELEGIVGPGGSGSPALTETAQGWAIAGIRSSQNSLDLGEGRYGVWEYYTRISFQIDWIQSVLQTYQQMD